MCHRSTVSERISENARELMLCAEEQARARHDDRVDTEHIVLGICELSECRAAKVLNSLGISLHWLRDDINTMCELGEEHEAPEEIAQTESAEKVLALSAEEAERFEHEEVDTDHVLIGLMREGAGVAAQVLSGKLELEMTVSGCALEPCAR
jgi:ATP-dependent Clp protease ATP-binding subunit ClpC